MDYSDKSPFSDCEWVVSISQPCPEPEHWNKFFSTREEAEFYLGLLSADSDVLSSAIYFRSETQYEFIHGFTPNGTTCDREIYETLAF